MSGLIYPIPTTPFHIKLLTFCSMSRFMVTRSLPSKDDFVNFWENVHRIYFLPRYLLFLALVVFVVATVKLDPIWQERMLLAMITAIVGVPIGYVYYVRIRYQRFTGCWQCRFEIGSDLIGKDPSIKLKSPPFWSKIAETGHCPRCDARLLKLERGQRAPD